MLLCAAGSSTTALYLADGTGSWQAEGTLPVAARAVSSLVAAPDGTLLLRASWGDVEARKAFVRSPRPLGEARAWRPIDLAGTFELRVDVGGAVLLFGTTSTTPVPSWFTITYEAPGEPRRALSGRIPVEEALLDAAIEERRVRVWLSGSIGGTCSPRGPEDHDGHPSYLLMDSGELGATPDYFPSDQPRR